MVIAEGRGPSRRGLLGGLAALIMAGHGGRTTASHPSRIVALDAPATEMLVTLGVRPAGVAGLAGYRETEGDLPLLRDAVDIGFFHEPNLELLQALSPDIFLGSFGIGAPVSALERIAPVISMPIYGGAADSYEAAIQAMQKAGEVTGRNHEASAFLAAHRRRLARLRDMVRGRRLRPVWLATPLLDGRHLILYGTDSLFDQILLRAGLTNAFGGPTSPWGIATVGIERLASRRDAAFLYIHSPVAEVALDTLSDSAIWRRLPFMRENHVTAIPYLEMYGALPTADRFTAILTDLIETGILDAD